VGRFVLGFEAGLGVSEGAEEGDGEDDLAVRVGAGFFWVVAAAAGGGGEDDRASGGGGQGHLAVPAIEEMHLCWFLPGASAAPRITEGL
jgi:hypothetical protein